MSEKSFESTFETRTFDAAIIGAGIGGTCAALALAKRGARVLLLEAGHFPRHKVCGEFLSPESRAVLARLGVLDSLLRAGAKPVSTARVVAPRGSTLDTRFPVSGLAISRFALDQILWRAAKEAGVLCLDNTRVKKIERDGASFSIQSGGHIYKSIIAIDATGRARFSAHGSTPADIAPTLKTAPRFLGLKAHFQNVRIKPDLVELHFWREGYCGLVNVEGEATNVCLLARYNRRDAKQNTPAKVWHNILRSCPALAERVRDATRVSAWQTTANVQFAARAPVDESGILRVGDAAGYIHPLTGDGMAMAARSGELAAAIVAATLRGSLSTRDAAPLYESAWQREFAPRLKTGDALGSVLLSPLLPVPLLGVLSRWPYGAQKLLRATRGAIL